MQLPKASSASALQRFDDDRLCLPERITGCLPAIAGATPSDVHVGSRALIVGIVHALFCLAVDADGIGGMTGGILVGILILSHHKALAACLVTAGGVLAVHTDVPLTTQMVLVVGTVLCSTF